MRANLFYAVDLIKITIDDDITPAEASAVVDEAHRQHLKVAVHAASTESIQMAIDAGADSIEHGNDVTDAQLKSMRDKGIFLDITPTFWGGSFTRILEASIVMSPAMKSKEAAADDRTRQRSRVLHAANTEVRREICGRIRYVLGLPGQDTRRS